MSTKIAIGVLGAGTVGGAVQELVANGHLKRLGIDAKVVKIYTRRPERKPAYARDPGLFTTDPSDVTKNDEIAVVVEVLGAEDPADLAIQREWVLDALRCGKSVVTANKALLVNHGDVIWQTAREHGCSVRFEACVAGGIPIIRSITESLCAETPTALYGILNGTSNYILTEMAQHGSAYDETLRTAQKLGYAEANPAADTTGRDAQAKLRLLSAVTFGADLKPEQIFQRGIDDIQPIDFLYASRKGRATVKPLAMARVTEGALEALVSPMIVPEGHFLSQVNGVTNAVLLKGEVSNPGASRPNDWDYAFAGPGAGGGATALAVLGDVVELARKSEHQPFYPVRDLAALVASVRPVADIEAGFYVRFLVRDQSSIIGEICQIFGQKGIHIAEVWQLDHSEQELKNLPVCSETTIAPREILPFVITLEKTTVGQLEKALKLIAEKDFILAEPLCVPILTR